MFCQIFLIMLCSAGTTNRWCLLRKPIFSTILSTLEEYKEIYGVKVYGFCLMTNHVHLILQPGDAVAGMGRLMKRLAGRQTRSVNRQELRTRDVFE